mgnify:FL=1
MQNANSSQSEHYTEFKSPGSPISVFVFGAGTYCEGDLVSLSALPGQGQNQSYRWTNPNGDTFTGPNLNLGAVTMDDAGEYQLYAYLTSTPSIDTTIYRTINVVPIPQIEMQATDYLCDNETYISSALVSNSDSLLWMTSGDGQFLTPFQAEANYRPGTSDLQFGTITLTLIAYSYEGGMCDSTFSDVVIQIREAPELEYVITREADCNDQNGSITVIMPGGSAGFEFSINDGASWQSNNHFDGLSSGVYGILAADQNGCRAYYAENPFTLEQLTECDDEVVFPTAFTPDGNGLNDTFYPIWVNSIPAEYSMQVFNRWGELVFETTNPYSGWDGRDNDGLMPAETYGYVVRVKFIHEQGNGFKEQRGVVRLVR